MFEELTKEMNQIDGQLVTVPIETDEKGYIDKQCPNKHCEFIYKVNEEDWDNIFNNEAVWCPLCRHEASADQWFTIEQVNHAKAEALVLVQSKLNSALRLGAQKFNNKQTNNKFISISMKVSGGTNRTYIVPASAAELMQLEIQCKKCDSRFAVIGSAYFCPACGHNSVTRTFSDSLRKIGAKKDHVDVVRAALTDSAGKDAVDVTPLERC